MPNVSWLGVDYGSKLAGTTAVFYLDKEIPVIHQSEKKKDADVFLSELIFRLQPKKIFIDAPLSLPKVYWDTNLKNKDADYFYRKGDREVGAMSPMFIGGLTARAMKLRALIHRKMNTEFYESYPAALAKSLDLKSMLYKEKNADLALLFELVVKKLELSIPKAEFHNAHQFDAFLCWCIGFRHLHNQAMRVGENEEGLIWY